MDEQMFSNVNASVVEISSTKEGTSRSVVKSAVSVPEKNIGRKNMKNKTANVKKSQHIIEEKAGYDAYQKATDTNIEKNRKRKADTLDESERNTEQESEDNAVVEGTTNAIELESNKNDTETIPNMKSARKEKTENISERKITDNSNAEDKNAENVLENKKDNTKISLGKAVHPPVSQMVLNSFKTLKKRNGSSVEEISKCIEGNFQVNINRIKPHIKKFLQKGVADGLIDQVNGSGGDRKFKIKNTRKVSKQTVKSKVTKLSKRNREVKKFATRTKKGTGKVMRKVKNDKVKPKK